MADMSAHPSSWYASNQLERPQGTSGTYRGHTGTLFPVVLDPDGLIWLASTAPKSAVPFVWVPMRGWDVEEFTPYSDEPEPVPEWAGQCIHDPRCTVERDCDALLREQGDGSW